MYKIVCYSPGKTAIWARWGTVPFSVSYVSAGISLFWAHRWVLWKLKRILVLKKVLNWIILNGYTVLEKKVRPQCKICTSTCYDAFTVVNYFTALANKKTGPLQVASLKFHTISVLQTALLMSYKETQWKLGLGHSELCTDSQPFIVILTVFTCQLSVFVVLSLFCFKKYNAWKDYANRC